jgi:Exoribonuclease R
MSAGEKRIIQRTRQKYWLLKYLKGLEGKKVTGVVSSLREVGASVYLPEYMLEVPVSSISHSVKEGDEIDLIVEQVDPLKRRIVLTPTFGLVKTNI